MDIFQYFVFYKILEKYFSVLLRNPLRLVVYNGEIFSIIFFISKVLVHDKNINY